MSGIFISYRREDSAGHAGRLFDRLRERFGKDHVFLDVSDIEPGVDFVQAIDSAVGSCDALIVVIGKKWLTCTDAAGNRRLDDAKDFIRLETAVALRRDIRVIPVLVQGATMPAEKDLPDDILKLARRQAIDISDGHWDSDTEALIETLAKILPGEATPPAPERASPPLTTTSAPRKNRLVWLISSITAVVVALGGLLSSIDSVKNTFSGLFPARQEKRLETSTEQTPAPHVTIVAPNLIGLPRDAAVAQLGKERLKTSSVKSRPAEHPPGTVIEQEPAPGSKLAPGSEVHLVVAERPAEMPKPPVPARITIPKLTGLSQEKAQALLTKIGLASGDIRQVESSEAKPGTVLEQEPPAGKKLAKGEAVALVVAIEPPSATAATVPKLAGLTVERARELLAREGLATGTVHQKVNDRARPGTVIDQRPKPGQQVEKGAAVELLIAAAVPLGASATETVLAMVPKLGGLTPERARESLARAGLKLGDMQQRENSRARPGTVFDQKPGPGQQVKKGTAVDILVASASVESGAVKPSAGTKVTIIAQGEPTSRRFWEGVKKADYSRRMAFIYSGILKDSAPGSVVLTINSFTERPIRTLEKMVHDGKPVCESTGADIVFAATTQETFASTDVESAYWPDLHLTAIVCSSGKVYEQRSTHLSPQQADKFPFENAMADAMRKFAGAYRHLLK